MFVYVSPLHINVDQRSCLWLVEFVYGVVKTINMELAVSVHDEGKSYMVSALWVGLDRGTQYVSVQVMFEGSMSSML